MPAIPDGYPFELSDSNLDAALTWMLKNFANYPEFSTLLPELKLSIIQAGLQEKARRETAELRALTSANAAASVRNARQARLVAIAALAVALATLVVAIVH